MLILTFFFCGACKIWVNTKVNYVFVFEFDTRHHLDWRQLIEVSLPEHPTDCNHINHLVQIPCFYFFLLGLFMWINFTQHAAHELFIYFPVLLIGISALIMFFPAPILYHKTRIWFLYSNVSQSPIQLNVANRFSQWRLYFAGLYPVEFRDFFLGDMFCSLTYAVGVSLNMGDRDPSANASPERCALLLPLQQRMVSAGPVQLIA